MILQGNFGYLVESFRKKKFDISICKSKRIDEIT